MCACKCVFMAVWYELAGACCVFVAYVFTHASIWVSDGACALVGLCLWCAQWMCKTVRSVTVHV